MKPKVSIIIPIYNVKDYLRQCLNSILKQAYDSLEVILVDDGSTDGSSEIAKEYVSRYGWQYHFIQAGGASKARNYGLSCMTGDYILFVDSDDYLLDEAVPRMVEGAESEKLDVYGYSAYTFRDNQVNDLEWSEKGYKYKGDYSRVYSGKELLGEIIKNQDTDITCIWNYLINANYWKQTNISFPEGIILEDNYVHFMMLALANRVRIDNVPLYAHRYHSSSVMATANDEKQVKAMARIIQEVEHRMSDLNDKSTSWYVHDFAWKYAGAWARIPTSLRQLFEQETEYVKSIIQKNNMWNDAKLMLFVKMPVAFLARQRLRDIVKNRNI